MEAIQEEKDHSKTPKRKRSVHSESAFSDGLTDKKHTRVAKACDRCRLKKSKCDGERPCFRCRTENKICGFERRRKTVRPKCLPDGYYEALELQHAQMVEGLQEMYRRLNRVGAWPGPDLFEPNGHPLVHDMLSTLGLLEKGRESTQPKQKFEDDCEVLRTKLVQDDHRSTTSTARSPKSTPDTKSSNCWISEYKDKSNAQQASGEAARLLSTTSLNNNTSTVSGTERRLDVDSGSHWSSLDLFAGSTTSAMSEIGIDPLTPACNAHIQAWEALSPVLPDAVDYDWKMLMAGGTPTSIDDYIDLLSFDSQLSLPACGYGIY